MNKETALALAQENFKRWVDALLTKDPKIVAGLYADDSTFLPTVSDEFKKGRAEAEQYFQHFLEKNPKGTIIDEEVQAISSNCYLHSGMYNFELTQGKVEARFTFVWQKNEQGEWQIIHHHSSVKPEV
jgi:uncharacterized protein (TIGR02246 family)